MSADRDPDLLTGPGVPDPSAAMATARFAVPQIRHPIPRPRLYRRLDDARALIPLILISAPAGSGKTSLVSSWLSEAQVERPAWVTLRVEDNDEAAFWRAIATAAARVSMGSSLAELEALASEQGGNAEEMPARLMHLINTRHEPLLLVLDNLHDVSSAAIHAGLLQLCAQVSDHLQLVIATRHDPPWPLHRMRLDGRLEVLRAIDLGFDAEEAAALFDQMALSVTAEQLDRLLDRTEGWAAGLQLAALGISNATDPEQFIAQFSGDDHSVADYLLREVFDRLPPDWQEFLQRVCVLDEICGGLADALTDGDDGTEQLARLAETNMFVHSLGHAGQWYRLHPLILDFLNGRLTDPRMRRDLHRRAAQWFTSRDMPWLALRHAVAGRQWELAADLAAQHVLTFIALQAPSELDALLTPLPAEVLLVHPGLAIAVAAAHAIRGDLTGVDALVESVKTHLARLPAQRRNRLQVLLDAIDIGRHRARGDLDQTLAACRRVPIEPTTLAGLGLESWDALRAIVISNTGTAELWIGDSVGARTHLEIAAAAGTGGGLYIPRLNAQAHLAWLDWTCGDLDRAKDTARETVAQFSRAGLALAPQAVGGYLALAGIAIDRDERDAIERWLELAADAAIEPHAVVALAVLGAHRDLIDDRPDRGAARIRATRNAALAASVPGALLDWAMLTEADLLRRAGDPGQSDQILADISEPGRWTVVRSRVHAALDAGLPPADAPSIWPAPTTTRETIEQDILRAQCALAGGHHQRALRHLERALITAAPQGMRWPFLRQQPALAPLLAARIESGTRETEFAVDLSHRMSGTANTSHPNPHVLIVPLTDRESIMLRYLSSALSNSEIAHANYVSVNTVKTHQRMIYRKLAVSGRRAAVARGHELGLI